MKNIFPPNISCLLFFVLFFSSCGKYLTETGNASYYGDQFVHKQMANGKKFSQHNLTAAHKTLPLGTKVTVVNLSNHKRTKVRITDRGPFVKDRIIDLSKKAAKKIDMIDQGVVMVELRYKKKR
jgi:rare lipoprotein A